MESTGFEQLGLVSHLRSMGKPHFSWDLCRKTTGKPWENHGKTIYAVFLLVNSPAPRFAYGYVNPYADRDGEINRDLRTIAGDVTPLSNTMICLLLFDCWCSAKSSMSSTKQGDV